MISTFAQRDAGFFRQALNSQTERLSIFRRERTSLKNRIEPFQKENLSTV
jgi:hypothetical protein